MSVVANRTGNDAALDPDAAILLNTMRRRAGPRATSSTFGYTRSGTDAESDADFITKLKAAWRIFFPEKQRSLSPKEEGKKRLRMILVADRYIFSTFLYQFALHKVAFFLSPPIVLPPLTFLFYVGAV